MLPIQKLHSLKQSLWYDNIQRKLLENGELKAMIERGDIRGVTSNPTIFQNAIAKTNDYDAALIPLAWSGWDAEKIFWQLAIEDLRIGAAKQRVRRGAHHQADAQRAPGLLAVVRAVAHRRHLRREADIDEGVFCAQVRQQHIGLARGVARQGAGGLQAGQQRNRHDGQRYQHLNQRKAALRWLHGLH